MYYILLLRDVIEIIFYSCIIYAFCSWLNTDTTKNITRYFLAYCLLIITSWIAEMPTLTNFLCSYSPITMILLIIIHEKSLQRNFISNYNTNLSFPDTDDWIDTLISSALFILNNNKSCTIIIENKNCLSYQLETPFLINAKLGKEIINILISSATYDENKMIWITADAIIRGINASWKEEHNNSILCTLYTDALIISLDPKSRLFTITNNGTEIPNVQINNIKTYIKKRVNNNKQVAKTRYKNEKSLSETHPF